MHPDMTLDDVARTIYGAQCPDSLSYAEAKRTSTHGFRLAFVAARALFMEAARLKAEEALKEALREVAREVIGQNASPAALAALDASTPAYLEAFRAGWASKQRATPLPFGPDNPPIQPDTILKA